MKQRIEPNAPIPTDEERGKEAKIETEEP